MIAPAKSGFVRQNRSWRAVSMMQKQHTPWNNRIATARLIRINIHSMAFL